MNDIDIAKEVKKHSNKYLPTTIDGIARTVRLNLNTLYHLVADLLFIERLVKYPSDTDFVMDNHGRILRDLNEIELACQAVMETFVHNDELLQRLDKENGL